MLYVQAECYSHVGGMLCTWTDTYEAFDNAERGFVVNKLHYIAMQTLLYIFEMFYWWSEKQRRHTWVQQAKREKLNQWRRLRLWWVTSLGEKAHAGGGLRTRGRQYGVQVHWGKCRSGIKGRSTYGGAYWWAGSTRALEQVRALTAG